MKVLKLRSARLSDGLCQWSSHDAAIVLGIAHCLKFWSAACSHLHVISCLYTEDNKTKRAEIPIKTIYTLFIVTDNTNITFLVVRTSTQTL
jgi:hypothetical protein